VVSLFFARRQQSFHFYAIPLSLFLLLPALLAQSDRIVNGQGNIRHDPELINKLLRGDFKSISDEHWSRIGQGAVTKAFQHSKCSIASDKTSAEVMKLIAASPGYFAGGSDIQSETKEALNLLPLSDSVVMFHPNYQSAVALIADNCRSERAQTLGKNLQKLIEERLAWGKQDHSAQAQLAKQTIRPVSQELLSSIYDISNKQARQQVVEQIKDLGSKGYQLCDCVYGPTSADGKGFTTYTFWYKQVPIPMGELMKVARDHPLGKLGDLSVTACPSTERAAHDKQQNSFNVANSKVDYSKLPPHHIDLDRAMGAQTYAMFQSAQKHWESYKVGKQEWERREAILNKKTLLATYSKSCEKHRQETGTDNTSCGIHDQMKDELDEIPDDDSIQPANIIQQPAKSASGIPFGARFALVTIDSINLAGVDSGRRFHAQLEQPVAAGGVVILPKGTDIMLKAIRRQLPNVPNPRMVQIAISIDYASMDGKQIPITTNEFYKSLMIDAPIMTRGRAVAPLAASTQVLPQTRLSLMAVPAPAK
jgi:hypothetical protein